MICDVTLEKLVELKKEFLKISKKGYIKGINNNYSSIGRTFENELKLSENEFLYLIIMVLKLKLEEHIVKVQLRFLMLLLMGKIYLK